MRLVAAFAFLSLLSCSTALIGGLLGGVTGSGGGSLGLLGGGASGSASGSLTASLSAALSGVQADLNALLNALASIAGNTNLGAVVQNALSSVNNIVNTAVGSLTNLLNGGELSVVSDIGSIVQGIVGEVQGTVNAAVRLLTSVDLSGNPQVGNLLGRVVRALGRLSSSVGGIVNGNVNAVIAPLRNVIQSALSLINSLGNNAVGQVSQAVAQLLQVISNTVNNVVRGVARAVRGATGNSGGLLGGLLNTVTNLLNDLLGNLVPGLLGNILGIADGLTGSVGGGLVGGGAVGLDLNLNDVLGQITNTLDGTLGTVRGLVSNVVGTLDSVTGGALGEVLGDLGQVLEPLIDTLKQLIDQLFGSLDDVGSQLGLDLSSLRGALDNLLSNVQVALNLLAEGDIDGALNLILDSLDDVVVYVQATLDGAGAIIPGSPLGQIIEQVENVLAQVLGQVGPALGIDGDLLDSVLNAVRRLLAALGGSAEADDFLNFDFTFCANSSFFFGTAANLNVNPGNYLLVATGIAEVGSSLIVSDSLAAFFTIGSSGLGLVRSLTNNAAAFLLDVLQVAEIVAGGVSGRAGAGVNVDFEVLSALISIQVHANTNDMARTNSSTFVLVFRDDANFAVNGALVSQIDSVLAALEESGINVVLLPITEGALGTALNLLSETQQQLLAQLRNAQGTLYVNIFGQLLTEAVLGTCN